MSHDSDCSSVHSCVQVLDNSPARKAGMEAYFDFLVSIDGVRLVSSNKYVRLFEMHCSHALYLK